MVEKLEQFEIDRIIEKVNRRREREFMDKEKILMELDISIIDQEKDKQYINKLNKNKDKVKYLRIVKGYTQEETASLIGISTRQVQRIEKRLKMSC